MHTHRNSKRRNRHVVQPLEARRLLAFTAEIVGSELRLTGTDADETVDVSLNGDQVEVTTLAGEELIATFDRDAFTTIAASAGAGNDVVRIIIDAPATIDGGRGNDKLAGGTVDDSINGGEGNDTLSGNAGADTLDGSGGDDRLIDDPLDGGFADDQLLGRSGRDTLVSNGGSDELDGGSELIDAHGDSAEFSVRSANLTLSLDGVANDGANGETGNLTDIEHIIGGSGDDAITGNGRNNALIGLSGDDTIFGLGGDDFLGGGDDEPNSLVGGDDSLDGGSGNDNLNGAAGNDTLRGQGGTDQLIGYAGNDSLDGGSGDDSLTAIEPAGQSTGFDTLVGGGGDDLLEASNPTPETIAVSMLGGSGNDIFSLNAAIDVAVVGAGGDDLFFVHFDASSLGTGSFSGGGGDDSFQVNDTSTVGVQLSLDGVANDGIGGGASHNVAADFESVFGGNGDDLIDASAAPHGMVIWGGPLSPEDGEAGGAEGNDTLIGGAFADLIEAGKGDDSLIGNAGEDVLRGSLGKDTLNGGAGIDSFNGGPQNDLIEAVDGGVADVVNGSSGLGDRADVDDGIDVVTHVEIVT